MPVESNDHASAVIPNGSISNTQEGSSEEEQSVDSARILPYLSR